LATAAIVFAASTWRHPVWIPVALLAAGFTGFANLAVIAAEPPLPVSGAGLHVHGQLIAWADVVSIGSRADRELIATVAGAGKTRTVRLRARGGRTVDDLRAAIATHAPEKLRP